MVEPQSYLMSLEAPLLFLLRFDNALVLLYNQADVRAVQYTKMKTIS